EKVKCSMSCEAYGMWMGGDSENNSAYLLWGCYGTELRHENLTTNLLLGYGWVQHEVLRAVQILG
ncbi:hypothetical protein TNCV_2990671, partial [Trichonephila clavipes]